VDFIETHREGAEAFGAGLTWHLGVELVNIAEEELDVVNFANLFIALVLSESKPCLMTVHGRASFTCSLKGSTLAQMTEVP